MRAGAALYAGGYKPELRSDSMNNHEAVNPKQKHKHLRRLARIWVADPVYFITTCADNRKPLLACREVADVLLDVWRESSARYGWEIGAYVIMPDHVHFFCRATAKARSLSSFVGQWKEWTSKRIVHGLGYSSPVWQREFFDHVLRTSESYGEKWNYVRDNPVRAGLVARAEDWPYHGHVDFQL